MQKYLVSIKVLGLGPIDGGKLQIEAPNANKALQIAIQHFNFEGRGGEIDEIHVICLDSYVTF